jgi:hypothetical protein
LDLDGLGARIQMMVDALGSQVAAAEAAGVGPRQMRKYVLGEHVPGFDVVAKLARAAGFDLNWAATGEGSPHGPAPRPLNTEVLTRVAEKLALLYAAHETGAKLADAQALSAAHERAQALVAIHQMVMAEYEGVIAHLDDPLGPVDDAEVVHALKGLEKRVELRRARGDTPPFGLLLPPLAPPSKPRGKRSA